MQRPARAPSQLSESLHKRLNMYSIAATAAGAGMLAMVQPAEAKIVYTPAHRVIGPHHSYKIDLNTTRSLISLSQTSAAAAPTCVSTLCFRNPLLATVR